MDMTRIDLNLLLVLQALSREGSVTGAARRLKTSQPTISYGLKKLRTLFDDELFVRRGSGMSPTPFAQKIAPTVEQIFQLVQDDLLFERNFDPAQTTRTFNFCMSDIGELVNLPPLLAALRREAPLAQVQSHSIPHDELQDRLADGTVDIALGYFPDLAGQDVFQQALFKHPFTCIARRNNPIGAASDGTRRLTLAAFLEAEHVIVSEKGRSQELAEAKMIAMGLQRRVVLRSPHFMSVPFIVANSDLISIVPKAVGQAYSHRLDLRLIDPPFPLPEIDLKQFWHRRVHKDPAIVWLRGLVSRLFLQSDPSSDATSPIFEVSSTS